MLLLVRSVFSAGLLATSLAFDGLVHVGEDEVCAGADEAECTLALRQLRGRKIAGTHDHDEDAAAAAAATSYHYNQNQARAFSALCKLTYCSGWAGTAKSVELTCGIKGWCAPAGIKIKPGSVRVLALPDGGSMRDVVAYAGILESVPGSDEPVEPGCVAAVRGTWPRTSNGKRNRQNTMVPWATGGCPDCLVHEGYQKIWQVLMGSLTSAFEAIGCNMSTPIYLTGHSMGGAVATIGMAALKEKGWNVSKAQYVFNNPMVFNKAGVDYFNKLLTGSENGTAVTRITHAKDSVPFWPWGRQNAGYTPTWPEVHYGALGLNHQVCWKDSKFCGVKAEKHLCSSYLCSDHLVSPLAPGGNIATFADLVSVCFKGAGTRKAIMELPEVAQTHQPSDDQLAWMDSQLELLQSEGLSNDGSA